MSLSSKVTSFLRDLRRICKHGDPHARRGALNHTRWVNRTIVFNGRSSPPRLLAEQIATVCPEARSTSSPFSKHLFLNSAPSARSLVPWFVQGEPAAFDHLRIVGRDANGLRLALYNPYHHRTLRQWLRVPGVESARAHAAVKTYDFYMRKVLRESRSFQRLFQDELGLPDPGYGIHITFARGMRVREMEAVYCRVFEEVTRENDELAHWGSIAPDKVFYLHILPPYCVRRRYAWHFAAYDPSPEDARLSEYYNLANGISFFPQRTLFPPASTTTAGSSHAESLNVRMGNGVETGSITLQGRDTAFSPGMLTAELRHDRHFSLRTAKAIRQQHEASPALLATYAEIFDEMRRLFDWEACGRTEPYDVESPDPVLDLFEWLSPYRFGHPSAQLLISRLYFLLQEARLLNFETIRYVDGRMANALKNDPLRPGQITAQAMNGLARILLAKRMKENTLRRYQDRALANPLQDDPLDDIFKICGEPDLPDRVAYEEFAGTVSLHHDDLHVMGPRELWQGYWRAQKELANLHHELSLSPEACARFLDHEFYEIGDLTFSLILAIRRQEISHLLGGAGGIDPALPVDIQYLDAKLRAKLSHSPLAFRAPSGEVYPTYSAYLLDPKRYSFRLFSHPSATVNTYAAHPPRQRLHRS